MLPRLVALETLLARGESGIGRAGNDSVTAACVGRYSEFRTMWWPFPLSGGGLATLTFLPIPILGFSRSLH